LQNDSFNAVQDHAKPTSLHGSLQLIRRQQCMQWVMLVWACLTQQQRQPGFFSSSVVNHR